MRYRVKDLKQVCHRGVWYYEGDVFLSDVKDLDKDLVDVDKGADKVAERGEAGTVPHFMPEIIKVEKVTKTKPINLGMEE